MVEESLEHVSQFGKWSEAGVPHRDWSCIHEFDAEEEFGHLLTCQMCDRQQIRFVHVMSHPNHDEELNCGCVCASHMSGQSAQVEQREKRMRSRAQRRKNFPARSGWKLSLKGNPYLKAGGVNIVIARNSDGLFRIGYKQLQKVEFEWDKVGHSSSDHAKLAAFEFYEKLRD